MSEQLVCLNVVTVSRLLSVMLGERLADCGVSLGQLPTLLELYQRDGQTQAELARATGVEQPTMAVNLRRMERDGLIHRVADENDRRQALIHLTEHAQSIRERVQCQRAQLDELSLAGVSQADRATVCSVLSTMATNLAPGARS